LIKKKRLPLKRQTFLYFFFAIINAARQEIAPKSMGMSDSSPAQPETAILGLPSFFLIISYGISLVNRLNFAQTLDFSEKG
jgi:hypothetical protein